MTVLEDHIARYLSLKQLLADIGDSQWKAGKSPVPREDTTERAKGMTSDPTSNTVADTRRLKLRVEVTAAELALEQATKTLTAAEARVAEAYEKWLG